MEPRCVTHITPTWDASGPHGLKRSAQIREWIVDVIPTHCETEPQPVRPTDRPYARVSARPSVRPSESGTTKQQISITKKMTNI